MSQKVKESHLISEENQRTVKEFPLEYLEGEPSDFRGKSENSKGISS